VYERPFVRKYALSFDGRSLLGAQRDRFTIL
jgi:hypothetical protein